MLDLPPEMLWRLAAFVAALSAMVWLETVLPRRPLSGRARRWRRHLGLVAVGTVLVALAPLTVTGAALWAQSAGIGLFNVVDLPPWASVAMAWLFLDAAIYAQHRALHAWPLLWRLHRVHHTDTFLDASTALRFHPFELLLSTGLQTTGKRSPAGRDNGRVRRTAAAAVGMSAFSRTSFIQRLLVSRRAAAASSGDGRPSSSQIWATQSSA